MAVFTPSLVAMYLLDRFYLKVHANHITQAIMHGVLPVVIAIILHMALSMGRPVMHSWWQALIVVAVASLAITLRVNYGLLDCRLRDLAFGDDGITACPCHCSVQQTSRNDAGCRAIKQDEMIRELDHDRTEFPSTHIYKEA